MRPALDVKLDRRGSITVMRLKGEFDLGGAISFDAKLQQAVDEGSERIIVDLRELSFLDSTGLRALIRSDARARREGWKLALTRAPRPVERIFELTRTDRVFQIVEELDGNLGSPSAERGWDPPQVTDLAKKDVSPARFPRDT